MGVAYGLQTSHAFFARVRRVFLNPLVSVFFETFPIFARFFSRPRLISWIFSGKAIPNSQLTPDYNRKH